MLTMAGNRMPMMVALPGMNQVNMHPPKLTEEEERRRQAMLRSVREHDRRRLKKCETDDKSAPIAEGKRSTPGGWVPLGGSDSFADSLKMALKSPGGPPAPGGPKGKGRGGLGDLFSGGFKPNPGALRGAAGRGRGRGGM